MRLQDAFARWDEIEGVEHWDLIALVRDVEAEADDEFPYHSVPIVALVVEDDREAIDLVLDPSSEQDSEPLTVGVARQRLLELGPDWLDVELYLRESFVEDTGDYSCHVDSPVVATAANQAEAAFAFIPWFEGFEESGLFPEPSA